MGERNKKWIGIAVKGGAQLLAAALFLACAWGIAYAIADNPLLVPPLWESIKKAGGLLGDGWFWRCFLATFGRVLLAFSLSFVLAVIFAVIAYLLPSFRVFFTPIVAVLRSVPVLAVALILLVWFGAGNAPLAVAFLSLFPTLYNGILAALSEVDGDLVEMSRAYNVPLKKRIFSLYLPLSAPYIVKEGGAALSFSLKLVVSAEVLVGTYKSLGDWLQEASFASDMPLLFALVMVCFITALCLEGLAALLGRAIERRVK